MLNILYGVIFTWLFVVAIVLIRKHRKKELLKFMGQTSKKHRHKLEDNLFVEDNLIKILSREGSVKHKKEQHE